MPNNDAIPKPLTYKQRKLITALLVTRTEQEAATMAGVVRSTVARWLALPAFRDELKRAGQEMTSQVVSKTMTRLTEGQAKALDVLEDVMQSGKDNERRQAAVSWLTIWREIREQQDFEDRLSRLEKELTP